MNYCKICGVYVDSGLRKCPLCGDILSKTPAENGLYPQMTQKQFIERRTFMDDLFVFLTFVFIVASILANLVLLKDTPWFLLVTAPILYVWILVRVTIVSDLHAGAKALCQILGITGVLIAIDFVGGWQGWSYTYVLPFLLIAGIVYIDVYSYIHKSYWKINVLYAGILVLLGFLPLLFYFVGFTHAFVPMVLCTIASITTVLGILRFTLHRMRDEIKKRFHI